MGRLDLDSYVFNPKHQWNPFSLRILNVARFTEKESIYTLIQAFAGLIRTSQPTARLIIVGEGEGRDDLEDLIDYEGLKDHIEIIENMESLTDQLKVCDLAVFLDDKPLFILKAMALGRIILASNTGGMTEWVEDQKTGYLFTENNPQALSTKITYALKHTGEWKDLLLRARNKFEANQDRNSQSNSERPQKSKQKFNKTRKTLK